MDDLISRQAAIDMFQRLSYDDWNQGAGTTWANAFAEAADMIERLPPAERKKGEWIRLDEYPNDVSVKCSECGVTLETWMLGAFYNYCPNCGADMRGEEDEID